MSIYPERFARTVTAGLAVALIITWSVITLADAYSQTLADMDDSYNKGLTAVYLLDEIAGSVERLGIDQRAFLSTGDSRFLDGVWSSVVDLERSLAVLRVWAAHNPVQQARVARLSVAVREVTDCVARCDDIKDARGRRAAIAYLNGKEAVFSQAQSSAGELRTAIVADILGRNLNARGRSALLRAVFYRAPAASRFGRAAAIKTRFSATR